MKECARNFLLKWSFFSTKIVRELTLHSAHRFGKKINPLFFITLIALPMDKMTKTCALTFSGSFHLLHMLLEDYILYVVEQQNNPEEQLALKIYPKQLSLEGKFACSPSLETVLPITVSLS